MQPYLPVGQFLELNDLNETSHYNPWKTEEEEKTIYQLFKPFYFQHEKKKTQGHWFESYILGILKGLSWL